MEPHTQMFRAATAPSTTWASYPKPELQSAPKSKTGHQHEAISEKFHA